MDAARWRRLDTLFQQALEQPDEARKEFLEQACPEDPELCREVAAMLAADAAEAQAAAGEVDRGEDIDVDEHDRLAGIVRSGAEQMAGDDDPTPATEPLPFESLGPYRLIEELGRGGLSTVYLAERDDAQFTMRVAIKLVRRGFDSPDLLDRLRLERQILARLEHPNIARLIDGGTAPDDRPYFVMERIEGERIDHWCERHQLDLRQRLELFQKLCDAVHTAHRRLVLHRDIKPSNILVTHDGIPKLLDFGIAKILGPEGEESSNAQTSLASGFSTLTSTGMRLLTPEFASPEQVRGETLTTASDVYSLGVLLYLLITGEPPYTFDRQRPAEVERVVCESEPSRPSAVVWARRTDGRPTTTQDLPSHTVLGWPRRAQGDDLDTIVFEALRKEPERRYDSVAQLADDLRCYLQDLPISARPDTMSYRAGKFIRRHRVPLLAAAALLIMLVAGVITTSWQARVARRAQQEAEAQTELAEQQRAEAERERRRAEEATTFLVDLFEVTDPYRTPGEPITANEVLDRGAIRLREGLGDDPLLRATLLATIGKVYQNLSLFPQSEELLQEALTLRRQQLDDDHLEVLDSYQDLANLWLDQERFQEAGQTLETVVARRWGRGEGVVLADALYSQALAKRGLGLTADAEILLNEAVALQRGAGDELATARIRNTLGALRRSEGDFEAAEEILQEVLAVRRRLLNEDHPLVAHTLTGLAITHQQAGDLQSAETLYRETLEMQRRVFGERHHNVVMAIHNLISVLVSQSEIEAALPLTDQLEASVLDLYGADHPAMARALHLRSQAHQVAQEFDLAIPLARRARRIDARHFGEDHLTTLRDANLLASLLVAVGDPEAETVLLRLISDLRRVMGPEDHRLASSLLGLAALRLNNGKAAAAEPLLREALDIQRSALPEGHWQTAKTEGQLGRCLIYLGQFDKAAGLLQSSYVALQRRWGAEHPQTVAVIRYLEDLEKKRPVEKP